MKRQVKKTVNVDVEVNLPYYCKKDFQILKSNYYAMLDEKTAIVIDLDAPSVRVTTSDVLIGALDGETEISKLDFDIVLQATLDEIGAAANLVSLTKTVI